MCALAFVGSEKERTRHWWEVVGGFNPPSDVSKLESSAERGKSNMMLLPSGEGHHVWMLKEETRNCCFSFKFGNCLINRIANLFHAVGAFGTFQHG
ncbi:MAG: hypothetical protein ACTS4U_01575 [Candidatus Hodgkinia cicadicola]